MTLATTLSRTPQGMNAPLVRVDVHVGSGLPTFSIVGLPETAVRESKDRVRAALANCSFHFPEGRLTVSLAPADLPKEGGKIRLADRDCDLDGVGSAATRAAGARRAIRRVVARRRAAPDPRRASDCHARSAVPVISS